MADYIDENGNRLKTEETDFVVEILVDDFNKNEPGSVVQSCKVKDNRFNRQRLIDILTAMSEEEMNSFCKDTIRLQQYADKYNGLAARYWIGIEKEQKDRFFNLKHPFTKSSEIVSGKIQPPTEEELQRLIKRVRNFAEIQPDYSNQPIDAWWNYNSAYMPTSVEFEGKEIPVNNEGNVVWVLYGIDIVQGIAGIAPTCDAAYRNFVSMWHLHRGEEKIRRHGLV